MKAAALTSSRCPLTRLASYQRGAFGPSRNARRSAGHRHRLAPPARGRGPPSSAPRWRPGARRPVARRGRRACCPWPASCTHARLGDHGTPARPQGTGRPCLQLGAVGDDDQRGTLNLIDQTAVLRGVAAAKQGRPSRWRSRSTRTAPRSAWHPGPGQPPAGDDRRQPVVHGRHRRLLHLRRPGEHGHPGRHPLGLLAHVGYEGRLYNGVPFSAVDEDGCPRLGIDTVGPLASRGVLLDVARALGVETFDDGHPSPRRPGRRRRPGERRGPAR